MNSRRHRILVVALIVAALVPSVATAQAVGGGISVWVPLDMFQGEEGSISFETALETSLGLGDLLSIPIGFGYNQVWGISPGGTVGSTPLASSGPWFYADSFVPYLMLQLSLPLGPLYVEVFGGGAAQISPGLRPLHDRIARDLEDAGVFGTPGTANVAVTNLTVDTAVGWGYVAGAALGVTFGQISVNLNATYRHLMQDVRIRGDYFFSGGASGTFDTNTSVTNLQAVMQGITFGIGGSFAM